VHLRHLNPLPGNVGEVLKRYKKVSRPRNSTWANCFLLLRAKYLVDAVGPQQKFRDAPFKQSELEQKIEEMLGVLGDSDDHDRSAAPSQEKIFKPTRKCAGAPAAATTPFSPRLQSVFPRTRRAAARIFVVISGIGCSSPLPVLHEHLRLFTPIHGRAPAVATGVKIAHPELEVWMVHG